MENKLRCGVENDNEVNFKITTPRKKKESIWTEKGYNECDSDTCRIDIEIGVWLLSVSLFSIDLASSECQW